MTTLTTRGRPDVAVARTHPRFEERLRLLEQRRRRRRRPLVVLMVITGLAILAILIALSPLADVDSITVTGGERTGVDVIEAVAGISEGDALIGIDVDAATRRLESLPWVADATVRRSRSGAVDITIIERVPIATVGHGSDRRAVDREGRVLAAVPAETALPSIGGIRPEDTPGSTVREGQRDLAELVASLPADARDSVLTLSKIDGELTALRTDGIIVELGDGTSIREKFDAVSAVLTHYEPANLAKVDVRVPNAVAVTTTLRTEP